MRVVSGPRLILMLLLTAACRDREVALIVIDPIVAIAAGKDDYRQSDIRGVLEPVTALAENTEAPVQGLCHFVKRHNSLGSTPLDRIAGSGAWGQVCRAAWACDKTPAGNVLARVKNSYGSIDGGITYRITETNQWAGNAENIPNLIDAHGDEASRIFDTPAKRKAADRLLNNDNISMDDILESHRHSTVLRCTQQPVALAAQDSTTLNFDTLKKATSGLTTIGGIARGIVAHINLAFKPGCQMGWFL